MEFCTPTRYWDRIYEQLPDEERVLEDERIRAIRARRGLPEFPPPDPCVGSDFAPPEESGQRPERETL